MNAGALSDGVLAEDLDAFADSLDEQAQLLREGAALCREAARRLEAR